MPPASLLLTRSGGCGRLATGPLKLPGCGSKRGRRGIRERPHLRSSATAGVRQRKEEGRASGSVPDFRWCQGLIQEAKPRQLPGQSPRKQGGTRRFRRSLKCRRPSLFLLHHQKAHSLFPRRGAPHKSPAKRVLWGRGNRRSAASGGKSEPVSRKRRDWRTRRGRESQCRDGVQGGNEAV